MQAADGQDEPTDLDKPQATGEGSANYPWYLPKKEKTAWKPGDEVDGWDSILDAFNQGRNFNKNLDESRGRETDQSDLSTPIATFVLVALVVWAVQVALSLAVFE